MTRKQLEQLPSAELIEIILQQQATLLQQQALMEQLQVRIAALEDQVSASPSRRKAPLTPPFSPPQAPQAQSPGA